MPGLKKKSQTGETPRWLFFLPFICGQLALLFKSSSVGDHGFDDLIMHDYLVNLVASRPSNWSHFWAEQSESCFRLDNICHGNDRWFYDSDRSRADGTDTKDRPVSITYTPGGSQFGNWPDKLIYFNVSSYHGSNACSFSSTPYHVVVQSAHNNMMGEFYMRFIRGMNQLIRKYPAQSEKDVQLYLHFFEEGKSKILHGHHLFLNGLTQHYKVDTFLSLVQDDSCQCFEKLAFCGYNQHGNTTHKTFTPASDILQSGGNSTLATLRKDIMGVYLRNDPMIEQRIRQRRRQILLQNGVVEEKIKNVDEWKIIGLTDRKYRRVWLNINDAIETCSNFISHKVICIKLNVEEADSSEEQLLMHSSLNSMIGIHGSQFTNAVFLSRHSVILELLPWIKYLRSGLNWVAKTSTPTPMGSVFHNSDIHHLGYCLGRESVPLCEHVDKTDEELEKACLTNETSGVDKQYSWDVRDFNVDVDIVDAFISTFILQNNTICDEMQKRGKENKFILYNVFCSHAANATESEYIAKHYYQPQPRCEV
ncbi:hypothetical protein ACHAXR_006333 [Thalassiosira sp. AJA248-18]